MYIYNCWRQQIYSTDRPESCWEGKYHGEYSEPGVNVYLIEYKNIHDCKKTVKKGIVSLKR